MGEYADKSTKNKNTSVAGRVFEKGKSKTVHQLVDNRPETISQLQHMVNNSPSVQQLKAYQQIDNYSAQPIDENKVFQLAKHKWNGEDKSWKSDGGASSSNAKSPKKIGDFDGQIFDDDSGTYTEEHRLDPEIQGVTDKERAEHEKKYNFGGGDAESTVMNNRGDYARALDNLSTGKDWYDPGEGNVVLSSEIKGRYFTEALALYQGTREQGHEIWIGFKNSLQLLLQAAFDRGYAINRPDIQQLIVNAAVELARWKSNGGGSAGRSDTMRR